MIPSTVHADADVVVLGRDEFPSGSSAPRLVQANTSAAHPALGMLAESLGLDFQVKEGLLFRGHSVLLMHSVREKTDAALVAGPERSARAADVDIITEATARTLRMDNQERVHGVFVKRPVGSAFPDQLAAVGTTHGVSRNAAWACMSGNGALSALGGDAIAAVTNAAQLQA
jgi:hypothetical protein